MHFSQGDIFVGKFIGNDKITWHDLVVVHHIDIIDVVYYLYTIH